MDQSEILKGTNVTLAPSQIKWLQQTAKADQRHSVIYCQAIDPQRNGAGSPGARAGWLD